MDYSDPGVGEHGFIRFKDFLDGGTQLKDRQMKSKTLLLTAPNYRKLSCRTTQGVAPKDRVIVSWNCRRYLCMANRMELARIHRLPWGSVF